MVDQSSQVFQFVNATVENPIVQDVSVRAIIRKQAMKKASAARKKEQVLLSGDTLQCG